MGDVVADSGKDDVAIGKDVAVASVSIVAAVLVVTRFDKAGD